jgi:hypothetical protein
MTVEDTAQHFDLSGQEVDAMRRAAFVQLLTSGADPFIAAVLRELVSATRLTPELQARAYLAWALLEGDLLDRPPVGRVH